MAAGFQTPTLSLDGLGFKRKGLPTNQELAQMALQVVLRRTVADSRLRQATDEREKGEVRRELDALDAMERRIGQLYALRKVMCGMTRHLTG